MNSRGDVAIARDYSLNTPKVNAMIQEQLRKIAADLTARESKKAKPVMAALRRKGTGFAQGNAAPINDGPWYIVKGSDMAPTVNDGDRVYLDLGAPMERGALILFSGPKGYFLRRWSWDKVGDRLIHFVYGDKNPTKIRRLPKNWTPTRVRYCLPKGHPLPAPGVWSPGEFPLRTFPRPGEE